MKVKNIGKYPFEYVCAIEPERDDTGKIRRFMPQSHYKNVRGLPVHQYGRGPFCRFRVPRNLQLQGVYTLLVDEQVKYVGECVNLSSRFNMGYGQISPRNCFVGGQRTNCKINRYILEVAETGRQIEVRFYETLERPAVEGELIASFRPPWNSQGIP